MAVRWEIRRALRAERSRVKAIDSLDGNKFSQRIGTKTLVRRNNFKLLFSFSNTIFLLTLVGLPVVTFCFIISVLVRVIQTNVIRLSFIEFCGVDAALDNFPSRKLSSFLEGASASVAML